MTGRRETRDWLIAHRGWPDRYPENSLEGIRAVLEAGARFVEFDVQITADERPVVIHDDQLTRLAGCSDRVTELPLARLKDIPVGSEIERRTRVPTLEAMLDLLADYPGVVVFVELKRQSIDRHGRAKAVKLVMQCLEQAQSPFILISFRLLALRLARRYGASAIGWAVRPWTPVARLMAMWLKPDYLFVRADRVPDRSRPFWPGPWKWVVYGVDDPAAASQFLDRGADMIEVDDLPRFAAQASNVGE